MKGIYRFGFIGAGAMAEAIITGMIEQGVCEGKDILVASRSTDKMVKLQEKFGVYLAIDNQHVVDEVDYLILAVKPQQFPVVCSELRRRPQSYQTVVSIMAGITIDTLTEQLGELSIFRAMPNTPAKVGWGMTGIAAGKHATEEQLKVVQDIFNSVGQTILVEEAYIDAVGAVSGSGPAYMYQILEALADGAVMAGLPRAMAYQLAAQTMAGSAVMMLKTGEHPAVLKDQVTSPGGTTICALKVMEEKGVRSAMIEAVQQAYLRSKELGEKK